MLYGEGERAFSRLQEEILKRSNDHSIFAWREPENLSNSYGALLARSPACFVNSGNIVPFHDWRAIGKKGGSSSGKEFQITNRGLRILLYTRLVPMNSSLYYAALNCRVVDNTAFTSPGPVWIFLHCISVLDSEYVRVRPEIFADGISQRRLKREADVVYIKRGIPAPPNNKKMFEFHIRPQKFNLLGISHVQNTSVSPLRWNLEEMRIGVPYSHVGLVGTMSYGRNGEISLVVMLSFSSEFGGVVDVFRATDKVDHIKQRLSIGKSKGHTTIQEGIVMAKTSTVRRTQLVDIFVFPIYI
jgi:hypothetical protein